MAMIESFSHVSAFRGMVVRYQFDETKYKDVSSEEISGEEDTRTFYKQLYSAPRLGFN